MPKINNLTRYPYDYVIRDNDFLLGSDSENARKTKNFPMFALGSYFDNYISGGDVDKVLSIGEVVTTTSDVTLNVHPMGNVVRISGLIYNKQIPDYFTFTPVLTGIKVLIIYALPDAQIFYLAEGEEGLEAVEPTLPQGALYVTRILVTVEGATIQPIDYTGFREKRIDGWYTYLMVDGENTVSINGLRTMKFRLIRSGQSQDNQLFLVGIKSFQPNYIYDGIPAYFKNDTGKDIILKQPDSTIGYNIEFANTPYLLKAGNTVELAYHKASNKFEIFKMGTAVSKTSELINDGEDGFNPFITAEDIPNFEETQTEIQKPTLVGNILTIKYVGENGELQEQPVDLSNLATIDIHIENASYNASTNVITLTDTEGTTFNIDLSEFSIITSIDGDGVLTLTQEGVEKLRISKVGRTGDYNDLLNKPTIPVPVDSVISLGTVTADSSTVYLSLHTSGLNEVLIDGELYSRNEAQTFPFIPVTTEFKRVVLYAKPDVQVFYIAQGIESTEPLLPEFDGLFIAEILLTPDKQYIDIEIPEPEVLKIGGRNLIIKSQSEKKLVLLEDGTPAVTNYSFISNFISVTEGEPLMLTKPVYGTTRIAHYDASQNFIRLVNGAGVKTELITIPTGVSFIKIIPDSYGGEILDGYQLERGNKSTDWQLAPEDVDAEIALKLNKPIAPNNVATRVINADGSTSDKGNFQLSEQIEIMVNTTADGTWRGKELWVLGNCTLTIPNPATLPTFWSIDVYVWVNCTLTLAITSPAIWVNGTPSTVAQKSVCRIVRRGSSNQFIILGV